VRLILVPVADRPECRVALDSAFKIGAAVGADVAGYHIHPERREQGVSVGPLMPDDDVHAAFAIADPRAIQRSKQALTVYRRAAAKHGFAAAERPRRGELSLAFWNELVGTPARVFAVVGPVADLTVVSRPRPKSAGRAHAFLLGALLHSTKPVLVLPQRPKRGVGRRIVIAWNQSPDAAAAVAAALPLLTRAERVVVVGAGREHATGPTVTHLVRYLAHWGIAAEHERTAGKHVEREIERACSAVGADLLVMGAYSRNRFRQLVFGGVTEHMLFRTELPAFMLHR
jgi:nucleotide-binding universal stress UspA family protein